MYFSKDILILYFWNYSGNLEIDFILDFLLIILLISKTTKL